MQTLEKDVYTEVKALAKETGVTPGILEGDE